MAPFCSSAAPEAASAAAVCCLANSGGSCGDLRPQLGAFLADGASDSRAFHLALVVADDTRIILEVYEVALCSTPGATLTDNNSRMHLLTKLGLSLLDSRQHEVAQGARGNPIQAGTPALRQQNTRETAKCT